jgi:precorrin-3B synthase
MRSGDGLVVRIRPHGGRLAASQAAGIAELAGRYGNGLIDLTSRANLQIRGVGEPSHQHLIDELARLELLDPDADSEARRNVLVTPFWTAGDETPLLAAELEKELAGAALDLPTKFGFAIDDGNERVLAGASADVRIERDDAGDLLVRADGATHGRAVTRSEAVPVALALSEWFVASSGASGARGERRRMATYLAAGATLPDALCGNVEPARRSADPVPGLRREGAMVAVAFGQVQHRTLSDLAARANALRLTPWRMLLAEEMREMPDHAGLITRADDPALRVIACTGAPGCGEAHADTRALATALAPHVPSGARLHVSGCAKGCAHSGSAGITLVATREGFDLVHHGSTRDTPVMRGLSGAAIVANPSVLMGGH